MSRDKKQRAAAAVRRVPPGSFLGCSAALVDSYAAAAADEAEVQEAPAAAYAEESPAKEGDASADTSSEHDEMEAVLLGVESCATSFISCLLEDAVEEYTDEAVREVVNVSDAKLVISELEPPILEVDEDVDLEDEDVSYRAVAAPAKVPLSQAATDLGDATQDLLEDPLDDYLEEEMSVVSFAGDRGFDLEEEEIAAARLADFIVSTPVNALLHAQVPMALDLAPTVGAAQQAAERWPSAEKLEPCTHRAFRRRLAPRQPGPPVPEEPFPGDCLPPSRPVAREVPPAAEVAALPGPVGKAAEAPPPPLSQEAEERLCSIASAAFAALRLMASEEASKTIQRSWNDYKARQILAKMKSSVALSAPAPAAPEAAAPPAAAPQAPRSSPGGNPRRRLRAAAAPAAPEAPQDSPEAVVPAPPQPAAAPFAEPPRPPTAPPSARPVRPGSRLTSHTSTAGSTAPPLALPVQTPCMVAKSTAAPSSSGAGSHTPRPVSLGCIKARAPPEASPAEGGNTPRTPRQHHLRPVKTGAELEAPKSARAPPSTASPADGAWAGLFAEGSNWDVAGPPGRALASASGALRRRKASTSTPPGTGGNAAGGEAAAATPRPAAGLSAMEMDLGFGPAAPSPRVFVAESPRNKASGTGLLPALHSKAVKAAAAGSVGWTIDTSGSLSARGGPLSARGVTKRIGGTGPLL